MRRVLILALLLLVSSSAIAQKIARPYPFDIIPLDTNSSPILDALVPQARELNSSDRLKLASDGHLIDQKNERVRLFGTSLWLTAQFLPQDDARILAVRLRKLGFNAVKLVYNDLFGWDDASLIQYYSEYPTVSPSSYLVNPAQVAKLDTLMYELKKNGIYSILQFNTGHNYSYGEGVSNWDSVFSGGTFHHLWDTTAARLQRAWATTMMNHVNPLTNLALKNDPMIGYVGFNYENSLYFAWQSNRLNYIDDANKLDKGAQTIAYRESRKLDTLFNRYLQKKYGTENALRQAWGGDQNPPKNNLIDNGSFESFTSQAWTFTAQNGANAGQVEGDGGVDSSVFAKIRVNKLSNNPQYNDIVLYNLSPRLGKDTLYELTFWAKMGYDAVKRPGIFQRSLGVLVFNYANNAIGLNAADVIDTAWKKYSFTFRTTGAGIHYVYLYFGTDLGDVWLDAFDLHRKAETPLESGEGLATLSVKRLTQAVLPNYPRPRTRDMVMFYDSLERGFYQSMAAQLHAAGYHGLVNWTQTQWYSMLPDIYKASGGDIAEHHTGWDYVSQRPNKPYSDSTWMIRNYAMVRNPNGGTFENLSANLVAGKANILGDYQIPWMNQNASEQLVLIPALASYQDMDGIFFSPFALLREDLHATKMPNQFANEGSFASISKNPAILSLLPSASYAFRSGAIKPASVDDTVMHDANDVWLYPVVGGNRGYHGVEGYLDPNAATAFRMRQSFNSKVHKVAAEYLYISDTAVKKFDQNEIEWDQTNGIFNVNTEHFVASTGFAQEDLGFREQFRVSRTDNARDILSYTIVTSNEGGKKEGLFTLTTRAQNSGLRWALDSLSFGKDFGSAPVVMSSATVNFAVQGPVDETIAYQLQVLPLDIHGQPVGEPITAISEFPYSLPTVKLDQSITKTPWYAFHASITAPKSVAIEKQISASIYPNPANSITNIIAGEQMTMIRITNALGQTVYVEELNATEEALDVSALPAGAYAVIIETAKGTKILPLRKL